MPLVDLDDPDELRARWSALAAVAHATGFDRRWYADELGWYHQDETGSDLRMVRLEGGRAVLFGFHTQHSRTAGADLLAGAPDWIGQPEVRERIEAGRLGFVYGSFNGTWARASYEGDPWQPVDDGFAPIGSWLTSDDEAAHELVEWCAEWAGYRGERDSLLMGARELIGALTFDGLLDFFERLGLGPRSPLQPDVRAGLIAAEQFNGGSLVAAAAVVDAHPGPAARAPEVPVVAEVAVVVEVADVSEDEEEEELFIVPPGVSPFTGQPIDDGPSPLIASGPYDSSASEPPYGQALASSTPEPAFGAPEPAFGGGSVPSAPESSIGGGLVSSATEPPFAPDPPLTQDPPYQPQPEPDPAREDGYGVVGKKPRRFGRKKKRDEDDASLVDLGLVAPEPATSPEAPYAAPGTNPPDADPAPGMGTPADAAGTDPYVGPGMYAGPGPYNNTPLPSSEPPRVGTPVDDGEDYYASLFADAPAAATYVPDVETDQVRTQQPPTPDWTDDATSEYDPFPDQPTPVSAADDTGVIPPIPDVDPTEDTGIIPPVDAPTPTELAAEAPLAQQPPTQQEPQQALPQGHLPEPPSGLAPGQWSGGVWINGQWVADATAYQTGTANPSDPVPPSPSAPPTQSTPDSTHPSAPHDARTEPTPARTNPPPANHQPTPTHADPAPTGFESTVARTDAAPANYEPTPAHADPAAAGYESPSACTDAASAGYESTPTRAEAASPNYEPTRPHADPASTGYESTPAGTEATSTVAAAQELPGPASSIPAEPGLANEDDAPTAEIAAIVDDETEPTAPPPPASVEPLSAASSSAGPGSAGPASAGPTSAGPVPLGASSAEAVFGSDVPPSDVSARAESASAFEADDEFEEEYYPTTRSPFAPVEDDADFEPSLGGFADDDQFHDEIIGSADWTADQLGDTSWPSNETHGQAPPSARPAPQHEDEPSSESAAPEPTPELTAKSHQQVDQQPQQQPHQPTVHHSSQPDDTANQGHHQYADREHDGLAEPQRDRFANQGDGSFGDLERDGFGKQQRDRFAGQGPDSFADEEQFDDLREERFANQVNGLLADPDHEQLASHKQVGPGDHRPAEAQHDELADGEQNDGSGNRHGDYLNGSAKPMDIGLASVLAAGMVIPGLGLVGSDGPRIEPEPGSIEEAMRAEYERPRPRPPESPAMKALHEWCRARTRIVPSGFTIQVQVLDPAAPSYRFDLEPPQVDDPQYGDDRLSELLGDLWMTESQGELGGWLFARIDAAGRTLRIDRWYDQVPDWWDNPIPSRFDVEGLVRRLYRRGPNWQPSYLEKLYTASL